MAEVPGGVGMAQDCDRTTKRVTFHEAAVSSPARANRPEMVRASSDQAKKPVKGHSLSVVRLGSTESMADGGFVNMDSCRDLPMEAFEISDEISVGLAADAASQSMSNFSFRRCQRKSIISQLGVAAKPTTPEQEESADQIDVYSKASGRQCVMIYMAATLGYGTFDLSKAVAKCGCLAGFLGLLTFSCLHAFLGHRLVELPQLVERNFATYSDIAQVCFNRFGWLLFVVLSVLCYWGICTLYLHHLMGFFGEVFGLDSDWGGIPYFKFGSGLVLVPVVLCAKGAKYFRIASICALASMLSIAALELSCALFHAATNYSELDHIILADSREDILDGLKDMALAFSGIGFLPYIVAEMVHPQRAKQLVNQTSLIMGSFYSLMGMVCYAGWGSKIKIASPVEVMTGLQSPLFGLVARLTSILWSFKTISTYPLLFWPLCREIEGALALDVLPAIDLQLPWALGIIRRLKMHMRVVLVFLTVGPLYFGRGVLQVMESFILGVPVCLVHYVFPSILALRSLFLHRRLLRERASALSEADASTFDDGALHYFAGNIWAHIVATSLVAMFTAYISTSNLRICFGELQAKYAERAPALNHTRPDGTVLAREQDTLAHPAAH